LLTYALKGVLKTKPYAYTFSNFSRPGLFADHGYVPAADDMGSVLSRKEIASHSFLEMLVYEGTGHALHWEEPKRFVTDLVSFIKTGK